ncbi:MAG: hypothetical protein LBT27_09015 [Prevotellaceae bacterium]|jgi:ribosomal protein S1|nr:hypothetical protein [Prevotellaceae bacterium]
MLQFIRKIFERKEKKNENEWVDSTFENIENAFVNNSIIPFKIVSIKKLGFLVKTGGLFAYIHFNKMPWWYNNVNYWHVIASTLKDKTFFGSILKAEKKDAKSIFIFVDGRVHNFKKNELTENAKYTGIIVNKSKYGLFIDIGYHFEWEYGSFVGLLRKSDILPDLFQYYEQGQMIEVNYIGTDESMLIFESPDLNKYLFKQSDTEADRTVEVQIDRDENGKIKFLVDGKYNAFLVNTKTEYILQKEFKAAMDNLASGDIIKGEILEFNKQYKYLQFRWIDFENEKLNELNECKKYLGKTADIHIKKDENKKIKFLIDGKYNTFLINTMPEHISQKEFKAAIGNLAAGDIIKGEILEFSEQYKALQCRWIDFENEKLNEYNASRNYAGKTADIHIIRNETGNLKFKIDGIYKAYLMNTLTEYISKKEFKAAIDNLANGDIISGEILEFNEQHKCLQFRWIDFENKRLNEINVRKNYLGKTADIHVSKDENGDLKFLIDGKHNAFLVKKIPKYIPKEEIKAAMENLADNDVILGEILEYCGKNFLFKWLKVPISAELTDIFLKHLGNIGKTVQIRVCKVENGCFLFKLKEKTNAQTKLLNTLTVFYSIIEEQTEKANEELQNGDTINAEIINFDEINRTFLFKWITTDIPQEENREDTVNNKLNTKSIANNIDEATLNKLKTISTQNYQT